MNTNEPTEATALVFNIRRHDGETCDAGKPCEMCRWANEQERAVTAPSFTDDWNRAPATTRRLVERNDAEYFWRKGEQAGRIAEQVETRRWLQTMMEGYDDRGR